MKKYVFSGGIFNILYIAIKHECQKIFLRTKKKKKNGAKNALFFLSQAPTHHSYTFNLRFLYQLKHKVRPSKTVCGIFHFQFQFVLIRVYIFVQQNVQTLLTLKRHNFFQNQNNRKASHSFAPRRLIFKSQQEVLKFNDIFVSWGSSKLTW